MAAPPKLDPPLDAIYKELVQVKEKLVKLRGTIKSADELVPVQEALGRIDEKRTGDAFRDAKGGVPAGQAVVFELLNECYDLKEELMDKLA